jgi:hypothetical protein
MRLNFGKSVKFWCGVICLDMLCGVAVIGGFSINVGVLMRGVCLDI